VGGRASGPRLRCRPTRPAWVVGWGFDFWTSQAPGPSPVSIIDEAIPDRPAVILEQTSHAVWVNSEALRRLNLGGDDPVGGVVLRDRDGAPTGILLDAAGEAAMDLALQRRG